MKPGDDFGGLSEEKRECEVDEVKGVVEMEAKEERECEHDEAKYLDHPGVSAATKPVSQPVVHYSWVHPSLEAREGPFGCGLYANQRVTKGETIVVWTGRILSAEEALPIMDTEAKHYILQIADGFYQVPLSELREPADWTNHSCDPNAGFGKNSPIILSAMRDIEVNEQILFDYGMCETDPRLWEPMECACNTPYCRKWITTDDYKRPELWERYEGYWAPHVLECIKKYRGLLKSPEAGPSTGKKAPSKFRLSGKPAFKRKSSRSSIPMKHKDKNKSTNSQGKSKNGGLRIYRIG